MSNRNGIGNRMTGTAEILDGKRIHEERQERSQRHTPGTHTLGKAFQTVEPKKDKSNG